ncbi:endonuclease III [Lactovum miscens]|uniref:Endonuclease III n=1 Tax=Lactovum miscens TaxID=190387 RepID=A0A841C9A5_9LACT|nr:endonuclease III [Lactovum miscens]MBB5888141.1 endonuclease-3 [Lactovum miscens]
MISKQKFLEALEIINEMFPDAHGELNWNTPFQLLVATILSAQATDKGVNKATVALFEHFPTVTSMANAEIVEIEQFTKTIGLYHNKSKSLKKTAEMLLEWGYSNNELPKDKKELQLLPGVGRKTANVVLGEVYGIPGIAVDTHVERVSKRLSLVKQEASVIEVEEKLMKVIPEDKWVSSHHHLIFFGRYHCTAKNPKCNFCPLIVYCNFGQARMKEGIHV